MTENVPVPRAIGPYSLVVEREGLLFLSGQIALDPATGELRGETAAEQTAQALANIEAVLRTRGLAREHVVKTTVYLVDLADFKAMNEVYAEFFGAVRPARSTVGVAALPAGAAVEIEVVACRETG